MKVYIRQRETKMNVHLVRYAMHWFAHMLMHPTIVKNLQISFKHGQPDENSEVDCLDYFEGIPLRRFTITIDPNSSPHLLIKTLAHEMVHVKQYATGELQGSLRWSHLTKWQGYYVEEEKESYWDWPWEIDAYGREVGLYKRFRHHVKINKLSFDKKINLDRKAVLRESRIK